MHYKILGYLNDQQLIRLRSQLDQRCLIWPSHKTWDFFTDLELDIQSIIGSQPLGIQRGPTGRPSVKLFRTTPGQNAPIHKDGLRARSALNICVDSNPGDWIRWWPDSLEDQFKKDTVEYGDQGERHSRNLSTGRVKDVTGWSEQFRPSAGCVYLINTDRYHTYHCAGPLTRRVIQTKFQGWPYIDQLIDQLDHSEFRFDLCL